MAEKLVIFCVRDVKGGEERAGAKRRNEVEPSTARPE